MKNTLVLLALLLSARTRQVCSQPYEADSDGNCHNSSREYKDDDSNLCCKKCPPGQRLIQKCSHTTDTVCKACEKGQYMESWNYNKNCFSCVKCKTKTGLQYAQNCSPTKKSACVCQPGWYCVMGFDDPHCMVCQKYSLCSAGYGASVSGTAKSNVQCKRCPDGTFSDTHSHTDPCRPHTKCYGTMVVRNGSAVSDTVCENAPAVPSTLPQSATTGRRHADTAFTSTASTIKSTAVYTTTPDSTLSAWPSVSEEVFNRTAKSLPPPTESGFNLVAVIAGIVGFILVFIILVLLCKPVWKKDVARFHHKLDANGNCESDDKQIGEDYLGETRLTSFTVASTEQQCLLEKVGTCGDYNHSIETLTRSDGGGGGSQEEIGPLQSTVAFDNSHCPLSTPLTLISHTEPVPPQPSVPSQSLPQSPSQPTSPQVVSPVTTSPHVNVNITFHIANGSCGAPAVVPTKLTEPDFNLPFGEEEESFSVPQQEDGKQSLMSVQDSTVCEESPASS